MKLYKYLSKVFAGALAASMFFGCEEDNLVKPHALLSESSLTFEAIGAEPQQLTIASDEDWMIDAPEWIWVDPMTGSNTVIVTVSVTDNVDSKGVMAAPREGIITIASTRDGYSIETVIYQKGDTYLGIGEYTVTEVAGMEDKQKAKISGAQVVAVSAKGFVVSDGKTNLYVTSSAEVSVGDVLYLNGEKSTANNLPLFLGDEVTVTSSKEVVYPQAVDITSTLDSYASDAISYISIEGTLVASSLKNIPGSPSRGVSAYEPHASVGLSDVNVHKVVLTGYYVGIVGGNVNLVVTAVKDNGEDDSIGVEFPFKDDFSWLDPYIKAANAVLPEKSQISDCVGNVIISADGAANLYSTLATTYKIPVLEQLRARGYTDLNPDMQTIYLQDAYFKFGATDKQSGLILPLMKIDGAQDIQVSFRWCCHLSAAENVDDVKLVVEIDGPGTVVTKSGSSDAKVSDDIVSVQKKGEMFWMDAAVNITGATKATFITIRPNPIGSAESKVTGVHRYYLDDIQVIPASAAVPAEIVVDGVEDNLITFEGTPDGPVSFNVTSNLDYTISTSAKWFSVDVTEGQAYAQRTVNVTCEPSDLSVLRKGSISIKSGTSTYTLQVIQSAAGQELAPFVSLKTGNNVTVLGEGEEFTATVQANVAYKVEILDSWIKEIETPASRAVVEFTDHAFTTEPNVTGAERKGRIRFYNEESDVETILNVNQENFIPRVTVTPKGNIFPGVSGLGGSIIFNIDANIPFNVSSDASWIKFPVSQGVAGVFDVPVSFDANQSASARSAKVTFSNGQYAYSLVLDVSQYASGVIFADDFSWLAPLVAAVNPTGADNYDTVGKHDLNAKAPNIYGTAALKAAFVPLCNQIGYYIPGKADGANDVLYLQDCYIKLGKTSTSSQTSFTLPAMDPAGKDMTISFDWARMEQASGIIDPYTLTLVIEGNGTFENGTRYSDELSTPQENGEMFWTNISVKVSGADKNTRITLVPTDLLDKTTGKIDYTKSGGKRAFYDNILVKAD